MIWTEKKSELRQVRSNPRRWFLGKFFSWFRREIFSSFVENLNSAEIKSRKKKYHP